MPQEMDLMRINVFNNESDFNAHKQEITENELSFVKMQNLDFPGTVLAGGAKLQPIEFKNMTLLTNGTPVGNNTSIELAQPYTDFDGLYFIFANDSINFFHYTFISTAELTRMIAYAKSLGTNKHILLTRGYYYWGINADTTTTTALKGTGEHENCYFCACYGVTL